MIEPDFADMTRRLHQKITACLSGDDLDKVHEFLREVHAKWLAEWKKANEPPDPYAIREVPGKMGGRAWIIGG